MLACRNPPGIRLAGRWLPSGARCIRPWGRWLEELSCSALVLLESGWALSAFAEGGPQTDWHHFIEKGRVERLPTLCIARLNFVLLASGNPAWAQTTEAIPCRKVSVDNSNMRQGKHEAAAISWLYC